MRRKPIRRPSRTGCNRPGLPQRRLSRQRLGRRLLGRGRVPISCLTGCRLGGLGHRCDRWTTAQGRVEGDDHSRCRQDQCHQDPQVGASTLFLAWKIGWHQGRCLTQLTFVLGLLQCFQDIGHGAQGTGASLGISGIPTTLWSRISVLGPAIPSILRPSRF